MLKKELDDVLEMMEEHVSCLSPGTPLQFLPSQFSFGQSQLGQISGQITSTALDQERPTARSISTVGEVILTSFSAESQGLTVSTFTEI